MENLLRHMEGGHLCECELARVVYHQLDQGQLCSELGIGLVKPVVV